MSQTLAEELQPTNHELMKRVAKRVETPMSMTAIAAEIGVHVDDLCHWIMSVYREKPGTPKDYQHPSKSYWLFRHATGRWSASESRRFVAGMLDGAAETRQRRSELRRAQRELAEGVVLYQGDCLEVLPTLGRFDAVVTDPPYGIAHLATTARLGRKADRKRCRYRRKGCRSAGF